MNCGVWLVVTFAASSTGVTGLGIVSDQDAYGVICIQSLLPATMQTETISAASVNPAEKYRHIS